MPRQAQPSDQRLLTKISKMYYEQRLTQQEISDRLHMSRPKVSRLLKQAEGLGIIQITVRPPVGVHTDLEQELEQRFDLKEAVVIDVSPTASSEVIARELGIAAAQYFYRAVTDGDVIGVSWGTTLSAMVNALSPLETTNIHIVQLIGGLGVPEADVHGTDICRRLAHLLGSKLTLIAAPGIVDTLETKRALLTDSHVKQAFDMFSRLTIAFVGIGVPDPASVVMRDGTIMSHAQMQDLRRLGAVGDIVLRFFDATGQPICSTLNDRVIGITLEELRHVERVVGVAGGLQKYHAVCGALRGRLINILITDVLLANELVARCAPHKSVLVPNPEEG